MFRCFDCNNAADDGRALVENGEHVRADGSVSCLGCEECRRGECLFSAGECFVLVAECRHTVTFDTWFQCRQYTRELHSYVRYARLAIVPVVLEQVIYHEMKSLISGLVLQFE